MPLNGQIIGAPPKLRHTYLLQVPSQTKLSCFSSFCFPLIRYCSFSSWASTKVLYLQMAGYEMLRFNLRERRSRCHTNLKGMRTTQRIDAPFRLMPVFSVPVSSSKGGNQPRRSAPSHMDVSSARTVKCRRFAPRFFHRTSRQYGWKDSKQPPNRG